MCFIKHYVPYIFCLLVQLILRRLQLTLIFSSLAFLLRTPHKNVVKKTKMGGSEFDFILGHYIVFLVNLIRDRSRCAHST
jgi:hypothetical protein